MSDATHGWGRASSGFRAVGVLLALVLAFAFGCNQGTAPLRSVTRLVAPEHRAGAESAPGEMQLERAGIHAWEAIDPLRPTATLAGETRPVLSAIAAGPRTFERGVAVGADGRLSLEIPSQPFTQGGPFVAVVRVRPSATPKAASSTLPGRLLAAGTTHIDVVLPDSMRAPELDVYVETLRAPSGSFTRYDTAPIEVAAVAELEFALGVLSAAAEQGAVVFEVSLCGDDGCEAFFEETVEPGAVGAGDWQDRRVALPHRDGQAERLRFEARWGNPGESGFSLPVWGDPRIVAAKPAAREMPSVVMLSIDTLRADHLELYGYPRETAPFTSGSLANGGVVFDTLVSAATTTGPSHMTMFTSLPPSVHRVAGGHGPMTTSVPTLAGLLRAAGYETAAVTDNGALDHERGFALGFDRFFENKSARASETGQVEITFERALDFIEGRAERPLFLFLQTFQVHDPYTPPKRYAPLFAKDRMAPARSQPEPVRWARGLMADYDREIRYVDDQLALFVAALEARGFFERGLLIVTSDHGEAFFEHGRQGHGGLPHEELLHAPLIFYGAGVDRGRRVGDVVTHADLMPTILEIAGVDMPLHGTGRSFAPLLRGEESGVARRPVVVSEAWGRFVGAKSPALAARAGRFKMIRSEGEAGPEYLLYDLDADAPEKRNLMRADPVVQGGDFATARDMLRSALDGHADAVAGLRAQLGADGAGSDSMPLPMDPDREAKLRALGYIE